MRLPFSLIAIALLFLSCETSPTKNTVDLKDIKAICDDLDFQFDHLSLSDSLNIYSKKINLSNHEVDPVVNDLETRKRIRKKSNPKDKLIFGDDILAIEKNKRLKKDVFNQIYIINDQL